MIQLHDIARLAERMNPDDWDGGSACRRTGGPCRRWNSRRTPFRRVIPPDVLARSNVRVLVVFGAPVGDRPSPTCRGRTSGSRRSPASNGHRPGRSACATSSIASGRTASADRPRGGGAVHALAESPWTRMPQWRRILHWARSRPPRYETWHSVVAALRDVPVEVAPAQRPDVNSA